jgi:hypothetical protein
MKLFFKSLFLFVALLVIINYPLSYFIDLKFHTPNKQNWILNKKNLKLDYAVLGASRVFNMIDIKSLDNAYGKKGINIGSSGSCYAENYVILDEFLSKNSISTLILNVDEFNFNSANSFSYPFHDYEFLPLFKKYKNVFEDFIPEWKFYLWNIIPISKYAEYNDQFTLRAVSSGNWNETMGTELLFNDGRENNLLMHKKRTPEIKDIDQKYFLNILQLCTKNKINVLLITTPVFHDLKKPENMFFRHYIDSLSTTENIPYYDYRGLIDAGNRKYFKDDSHTNSEGSIEYSINLGKKLKEDMR